MDSIIVFRQHRAAGLGRLSQRVPVALSGSRCHRGRRRAHNLPVFLRRASHRLPLPLPPLLLLLLLLLRLVGLQSTAVASVHTGNEVGANPGLDARIGPLPSSRRLDGLPGVTVDAETEGGVEGGEKNGNGKEGAPAPLDERASEALGVVGAGEEDPAAGEVLTPEESAEALLADRGPRCFFSDVEEPSEEDEEEEGGSEQRMLCLPTLFFLGVSKCGTTSFSEWMSHHPRIRWVRRPQHLYYLEAHVFDIPPDAAEWRRSVKSPSSSARDRLGVEAQQGDTVIDYTPNYSLVAEVPYRISSVYGRGPLRERGLKFLVVLREPAARTISSWEYKTDPELAARVAAARHPEVLLASLADRAVEARPLKQAAEEGMEMVMHLAACVANATAARGEYGLGGYEVTLCDGDSLPVADAGCEDSRDQEREQNQVGEVSRGSNREGEQEEEHGQGRGEGCGKAPCETYVEPWCNPADFLEDNLYDAHVGKSAYALQLARWFAVFGKDKFKVIFTDDMAEDPMGTLEDVLGFLELDLVDPEGIEGLRNRQEWEDVVRNRSNEADPEKKAKLAPQVTPEIVESLRDFFAPHNSALEELLGVPVPAGWRTLR